MERSHEQKFIDSYLAYLKSPTWKKRSDEAIFQAGGRCRICYGTQTLQAHHRTYRNLFHEQPGDLTVLCGGCHRLFTEHKRMGRLVEGCSLRPQLDQSISITKQKESRNTRPVSLPEASRFLAYLGSEDVKNSKKRGKAAVYAKKLIENSSFIAFASNCDDVFCEYKSIAIKLGATPSEMGCLGSLWSKYLIANGHLDKKASASKTAPARAGPLQVGINIDQVPLKRILGRVGLRMATPYSPG